MAISRPSCRLDGASYRDVRRQAGKVSEKRNHAGGFIRDRTLALRFADAVFVPCRSWRAKGAFEEAGYHHGQRQPRVAETFRVRLRRGVPKGVERLLMECVGTWTSSLPVLTYDPSPNDEGERVRPIPPVLAFHFGPMPQAQFFESGERRPQQRHELLRPVRRRTRTQSLRSNSASSISTEHGFRVQAV